MRLDNPAAFLAGIAFNTLQPARPASIAAPLAHVSDEMNQRLQQTHRITGKVIGGHPCIVAIPKQRREV